MQIEPFLSWDTVHPGACHWNDARQCIPCDISRGVELRVEPASKSGPILKADRPWECETLAWVQVMEDEGVYRMWYGISGRIHGEMERLCYAQSDDGFAWHKPELGIVEVHGSRANNVVFEGPGANHFCVFKDPVAPPEARYRCWIFKSWWEGRPGQELDHEEGMRRLNARNAAKPGEEVPPVALKGAMIGLNSPDGLCWTPIEKPILDEWHDTHNICAYDETRGKYVGYFRGFYGGRRAISYAETDDFERWPPTEVIHHHGIEDGPGDSLYSNCYTRYPDVPGLRLMFPAVYHLADDSVDGQLAVSRNGKTWARHTRQAIVPRGGPGERDEGHVYPEPELIRFRKDGKFRLPLRCGAAYHNQGYNPKTYGAGDVGAYAGWAEWTEDRLAGVHAPSDGAFTTQAMPCGERMIANFRAAHDGWVRFELVDRVVWPPIPWPGLDGYRFEDMEPLRGDRTHCPASWKGRADLSPLQGKPVCVRVQLYKATLFSVTMYGRQDTLVQDDPRFPV